MTPHRLEQPLGSGAATCQETTRPTEEAPAHAQCHREQDYQGRSKTGRLYVPEAKEEVR